MKFGSVCSGIEAATVAWGGLGWTPQWYSEIEPFACAVLKQRDPEIPNLGDMTKIYEREEFKNRSIDLLVGGTPCQSFSVAGLRKGLASPNGNLALVFLSVLNRKRPRWVVWENVAGVLSSWSDVPQSFLSTREGETHQGIQTNDFDTFTCALWELGYGLAWRILDAQYFGVPQRRRRVFVVGYLGDWRPAAEVLFESQSLSWHPAPRRQAGETITGPLEARARGGGGLGDIEYHGGLIHAPEISPALKSRDYKGPSSDGDGDGAPLIAHSLRAEGFDASEDGTGRGIPLVSHSLRASHTKEDGTCRGTPVIPVYSIYDMRGNGNGEVSPTLSRSAAGDRPNDFAPVVQVQWASGGGKVENPTVQALRSGAEHNYQFLRTGTAVRRLTPQECERLQGFPNDYTLVKYGKRLAADGPRYKAIGNSMAVPVMRWLGKRIQMVEDNA